MADVTVLDLAAARERVSSADPFTFPRANTDFFCELFPLVYCVGLLQI